MREEPTMYIDEIHVNEFFHGFSRKDIRLRICCYYSYLATCTERTGIKEKR